MKKCNSCERKIEDNERYITNNGVDENEKEFYCNFCYEIQTIYNFSVGGEYLGNDLNNDWSEECEELR